MASDLSETRFQKLEDFSKKYYDPYSKAFSRSHIIQEIIEADSKIYRIAGRICAKRIMGKSMFLDVRDESGKIQVYSAKRKEKSPDITIDRNPPEPFDILKMVDIGDIIGVVGTCFLTKKGEKTMKVHSTVLLAKCLHPIPVVKEKKGQIYDKLSDHEIIYRQRYLDLLINEGSQQEFKLRSKIIQSIRMFLDTRNFLEVETPMLQATAGGAIADPFKTHHKALNMPLYLRIAPELYLKQLIIGGYSRIFEINRNFRNEGISVKHNPEFTMLELYGIYMDVEDMISLFEEIVCQAVKCVSQNLQIVYQDKEVSFVRPWKRLDYLEAIRERTNLSIDLQKMDTEGLRQDARNLGLKEKELNECNTFWNIVELIFDQIVEPDLIDPIIIVNHPKAISPLAKASSENEQLTQRFEPYVMGREIGNGFSELNNPIEQRERFIEQQRNHPESRIDEAFLKALEYGMPPTGGLGIGIDRLIMLLMNKTNIRDTLFFPLLRPLNVSNNEKRKENKEEI